MIGKHNWTEIVWCNEKWERGRVIERQRRKIYWHFDLNLTKTELTRRPDLVLEHLDERNISMSEREEN